MPPIARAWVVLMKRPEYTKFAAQGGDWGAIITEQMGARAAPEPVGIHANMRGTFLAEVDKSAPTDAKMPDGLSSEEKLANERLQFAYRKGVASTPGPWSLDILVTARLGVQGAVQQVGTPLWINEVPQ
jgi:hypothetical protein